MRRLVIALVILALATTAYAGDRIKFPQFALSATFAGLSAADTALTIYGTSRLGLGEANGIMRPFLENRRYAALWAVQTAGCAAILAGCHLLIHGNSRTARFVGYAMLVAANVGRAYIVLHNMRLNREMKGRI